MKKALNYPSYILLVFFTLISCNKEEDIPPTKDINELIMSAGRMPEAPVKAGPTLKRTSTTTETGEGGAVFNCNTEEYTLSDNTSDVVIFNPNSDALWPGSIVQGAELKNGVLSSIGNFPRNPVTITMSGGESRSVENPSNATITSSVNGLVETSASTSKPAIMTYTSKETYSAEQSFLGLGIDVNWLPITIRSSFQTSNNLEKRTLFVKFTQSYYTISVESPSSPASFFTSDVSVDDLRQRISINNPACYVSSVTYGRIILLKMTSTKSYGEMKAALQASYGIVGGGVNYTTNQTLEDSEFEWVIVGGSAQGGTQAITSGSPEALKDLINNEAEFSAFVPGQPISYTVRNLADNSLVKFGKTLDYSVKNCTADPNSLQQFDITLRRFDIDNDCDPLGSGEFTYKFRILDGNGNDLATAIEVSSEISANSGEAIQVNTTKRITLPKSAGQRFTIQGYLREMDGGGYYEEVGTWENSYYFPWNVSDLSNVGAGDPDFGHWKHMLDNANDCNGKVVYKIVKL